MSSLANDEETEARIRAILKKVTSMALFDTWLDELEDFWHNAKISAKGVKSQVRKDKRNNTYFADCYVVVKRKKNIFYFPERPTTSTWLIRNFSYNYPALPCGTWDPFEEGSHLTTPNVAKGQPYLDISIEKMRDRVLMEVLPTVLERIPVELLGEKHTQLREIIENHRKSPELAKKVRVTGGRMEVNANKARRRGAESTFRKALKKAVTVFTEEELVEMMNEELTRDVIES